MSHDRRDKFEKRTYRLDRAQVKRALQRGQREACRRRIKTVPAYRGDGFRTGNLAFDTDIGEAGYVITVKCFTTDGEVELRRFVRGDGGPGCGRVGKPKRKSP